MNEINDPDLRAECGGRGVVEPSAWVEWWRMHDEHQTPWEKAHPGQLWLDSDRYAELDALAQTMCRSRCHALGRV